MDVLVATHLRKDYGRVCAVRELSFHVGRGEILGLLGPNGAGKTTAINMVLGVLAPTSGEITIEGFPLATRRRQALARTNFAAVYAPLPGNLTVEQNLRIFSMYYGLRDITPRIERLLAEFDLLRLRHEKCGVLSSGEQTRASLAKAMLNDPKLLLLDEPTASLDPSTAKDVRAQIRDFAKKRDGAVLWTSHNMYEVEEVCDRVLLLSQGKVLLEGDPRRLPAEHGAATLEALFVTIAREGAAEASAS